MGHGCGLYLEPAKKKEKMGISYRFDPPLCIPPHGSAEIEPDNDAAALLDRDQKFFWHLMVSKQPKFIRVSVKDKYEVVLANGLYEQDSKDSELYRLKEGTAYVPNHL